MTQDEERAQQRSWVRTTALIGGPLLYAILFWLAPRSLTPEARHVLGITAWMAVWWISECVPLVATSLMPAALFPLLGVATSREAIAPYASDLVFLFLAGFLLAAALERWNAHARVAYALVSAIGFSGRRVVLGVMIATGFISMWISNTATAAMMFPIALAIGALFGEDESGRGARTALMLGVAYAASIGGIGTLIGTPPNLIFAGAARELAGREVSFVGYMGIGVPLVIVLLPICWLLLVGMFVRGRVNLGSDAERIVNERRIALGPLRGAEALTLLVFGLTALAWVLRERKDFGAFVLPGLVDWAPRVSDASIGVFGAILLFIIRGRDEEGGSRPLLMWSEARTIPWDVLLLFGGGLSLAAAMESSGLAKWLGGAMSGLSGYPTFIILAGLALIVLVLSEFASNTAVASMAMPIAASLAEAVGHPPLLLMLVAALAASTGFALPIATPPNTIVFGSGQVRVRHMLRAGVALDLISVAVIVAMVSVLYGVIFE
jgi:solute carrier family 13 (sodium-dependent dicarboxylate transporter), member 2/3/5